MLETILLEKIELNCSFPAAAMYAAFKPNAKKFCVDGWKMFIKFYSLGKTCKTGLEIFGSYYGVFSWRGLSSTSNLNDSPKTEN